MAEAAQMGTVLDYKPASPVMVGDRVCFAWPISDATLAKVRGLLGDDTLVLGFHSTIEQMPPFACPECGQDITFADYVREALKTGVHGREFLTRKLEQVAPFSGQGPTHEIHCEQGHKQPVLMGWPYATFNWVFR